MGENIEQWRGLRDSGWVFVCVWSKWWKRKKYIKHSITTPSRHVQTKDPLQIRGEMSTAWAYFWGCGPSSVVLPHHFLKQSFWKASNVFFSSFGYSMLIAYESQQYACLCLASSSFHHLFSPDHNRQIVLHNLLHRFVCVLLTFLPVMEHIFLSFPKVVTEAADNSISFFLNVLCL